MRNKNDIRPNNESSHNRVKPNRILCCYCWCIFWGLVMGMSKKRQAIWDKSGGKCWYCGCDLPNKGWHADHFEPVRRDLKMVYDKKNNCHKLTSDKTMMHSDRDTEENKVPSCASCNIIKSSQSIEGFRTTIKGFIKSLNRDSTQYKFSKRYGLLEEKDIEVKFWFEENINGKV